MNYKRIYDNIINKRNVEIISNGYFERHHILPRSLNGTNDNENLVNLTAREHFLCHYLLTKIYDKGSIEWIKMIKAFSMMKVESINQHRYFNSKLYDFLRKDISLAQSISQMGSGNSQYGTIWIYNLDKEESRKINVNELLPKDWIK